MGADEYLLPSDGVSGDVAQEFAGTATSVTTSAQNITVPFGVASRGQAKGKGQFYIAFQARGSSVYIRAKSAATSAATTNGNGSNGVKIPDDGQVHGFWISAMTPVLDVIGDGACTLFWWQSSPNYANRPNQ